MQSFWRRLSSRQQVLLASLLIFAFSLTFFLIGIGNTVKHSFDEFHYVPAAKQYLDWHETSNWEHPPLAKLLMAIGIGTFGDNPLGWRFMSTVFGALTLVGMFLWALALFEETGLALWVAGLTFVNSLVFVQSRIGMLDTFMAAFLVWALAAFTAAWNAKATEPRVRRFLLCSGIFFGLATACKWFAVMPLFGCAGLFAGMKMLQSWGTRFTAKRAVDVPEWYTDSLWGGLGFKDFAVFFGLLPFVVYFITFIPLLVIQKPALGLLDFFPMQLRMYDGQLRVVNSHPYMSDWKQWPLLLRPIWYTFDHEEGSNIVHGVALIGNPLVMWAGLVAILVAALDWFRTRARDSGAILFFYVILFGAWILIPRKIAFYYYYYPAGLSLSLAIGWFFYRGAPRSAELLAWAPRTSAILGWVFLGAACGLFAYFYPILSGMPLPGDAFRRWMWFSSWI